MNDRQRRCGVMCAAACVCAVLFPPFHHVINGTIKPAGFAFLLSPPSLISRMDASVNLGLLAIELVVILIVGASLIAFFADRRS